MRLNPVATELTTAATDAVLGALCLWIVWWLSGTRAGWAQAIWMAVFALMAVASILGAAAHGLALSDGARWRLWQPLYLSLGLMIALLVVAGLHDSSGEATARTLLPWALLAGVGFYAVTLATNGGFGIFIAYEAVAMLGVLVAYGLLWSRGQPGAGLIVCGIGVSVIAAVVQASRLRVSVVVPFDHNGLFHLVQIVGTGVLAAGVRASFVARP